MQPTRTYRNTSYPVFGWIGVVALVTGGMVGAITPHNVATFQRILIAVIPISVAVLIYRAYAHTKLVAWEGGLTVFNPFRTIDLKWTDVEGFDMVTAILRVRLNDGGIIRVWAVQPSGLRHVLTRGSHADEILHELGSMRTEFLPDEI